MLHSDSRKTTELIEELLRREDPALVGVKKILRKKAAGGSADTSFKVHTPEVFLSSTHDKSDDNTSMFTDEEKRVVELEKQSLEMRDEIEAREALQIQAVQEAYNAGVEEGRRVQSEIDQEQLRQQLDALSSQADDSLMELIQRDMIERDAWFSSLTDEIMKVSFAVARQIITTEIQQDRSIVERIVRRAIFYLAQRKEVEIRVNPEDVERVRELIHSFQEGGERFVTAMVTPDTTVAQGGCLIESPAGIVDATIDRQFEELEMEVTRLWHDFAQEPEELRGTS